METNMIVTRGFKNIIKNGKATGFQIKMMVPSTKFIFLSTIGIIKLKVDGEDFQREKIQFKVGRKLFSYDELDEATEVNLDITNPLTLVVSKDGGLTVGTHDIELIIMLGGNIDISNQLITEADMIRAPMMSAIKTSAIKKITLVQ